jgi:hypothetical protein
VNVLEADRGLADQFTRLGHRQQAALVDQLGQVDALDKLHDQQLRRAEFLGLVDGDDVGVRKARGQPGLALKALHRVGDQVGADHFQDHGPFQQAMLGPVHGAHAAAAEHSLDAVTGMQPQLVRQPRPGGFVFGAGG